MSARTAAPVDVFGPGSFDPYPGNGNCINLDGRSPTGPTYFYLDVSTATAAAAHPGYVGARKAKLRFDIAQDSNGTVGREVTAFIAGLAQGASVFSTFALTNHTRSLFFSGPLDATYTIGFFTPSSDGQGPILDRVSFSISPVPEPGTYAFMLAGLGLVGWRARRRGLRAQ